MKILKTMKIDGSKIHVSRFRPVVKLGTHEVRYWCITRHVALYFTSSCLLYDGVSIVLVKSADS